LQKGQTDHILPAGSFKNDLANCSYRHVVSSYRGLPGTSRTKTATTHAVLAFWLWKLAEGPNRPCFTCWQFQKQLPEVLLLSSCVKLLWVTLDLANENRHHTRNSCFPVVKTCGRAKRSILYLLAVSKTICQTVLAVMLCQVIVSYPAAGEQKPPSHTQFLLSSRENLQKG